MASNWIEFETEAFEYLKANYNKAEFTKLGEHDSNLSDIGVKTSNGQVFNIEIKMNSAQSGQFVLFPNQNTRTFKYSSDNKYAINEFSETIMGYMNNNFDIFKNVGTKGVSINMDSKVFADWITTYYKNKNVKYFITSDNKSFIIFSIDKFADYFNVSAVFRGKKSGSTHPSKKNRDEVVDLLKSKKIEFDILDDNKKMFIKSQDIKDKMKIVGTKYSYMFADKGECFEVRQLSNTCNSNVIFSIELKSTQNQQDLQEFELHI